MFTIINFNLKISNHTDNLKSHEFFYFLQMNRNILIIFESYDMVSKNKYIKHILALFFVGVLLLPSLLDVIHHCDTHVHSKCNEQKAHVHQSVTDCEICDFNLLDVNYKFTNNENSEQTQIFAALNPFYTPIESHSFLHQSTQLRAPPVIS